MLQDLCDGGTLHDHIREAAAVSNHRLGNRLSCITFLYALLSFNYDFYISTVWLRFAAVTNTL